jgi:hypothetical protein
MTVLVTDRYTIDNPTNGQDPKPVHPSPKLTDVDCEEIANLEFEQHENGVVHFKHALDVPIDELLPYVNEEAQPSNCGLKWMEEDGEKWAEDYQGNRHDIRLLMEQPFRLGGLGENEPVMDRTPGPLVDFFNNCETALYKCLIRYIDLYPMILNTIWWKMRGHVLYYKPGALLGLHNDNDTNFRVIDGQRYETQRPVAIYQVLNGTVALNDNYEGGNFIFPYSKLSLETKTGDIVLFPANFMGSHGVSEVTSGCRYSYLTQFGQGKDDKYIISEATDSHEWLPPVYLPWIFQDYERFFKSGHSKSEESWSGYHRRPDFKAGTYESMVVANPVSQQRSLEGDAAGVYQPYDA